LPDGLSLADGDGSSSPESFAIGGQLADEAAGDAGDWSPGDIGRLASFTPERPAAVDLALQQFLDQVEDLGRELGTAVVQTGLTPWVVAVGAAAAAFEVSRRRLRRAFPRVGLAAGASDVTLTWATGLAGPFSTLEP
jgi:hypothetical protein